MASSDEPPSDIGTNLPKADTSKAISLVSRVSRPNSPQYSRINQETPSCQLGTPVVTTGDAAREAARKANSEISTVGAPIQSVVSVVSDIDNLIGLVHWIFSFLQTLKKFNDMVDKIATVSLTLCRPSPPMLIRCLDSSLRTGSVDYPLFCFQGLAAAHYRARNLIYGLQVIIEQVHLDASICALLSKMNEVYTFLTTAELNDITSMKTIVERITHQTVQCSYFIQAYCVNQKFRKWTWL